MSDASLESNTKIWQLHFKTSERRIMVPLGVRGDFTLVAPGGNALGVAVNLTGTATSRSDLIRKSTLHNQLNKQFRFKYDIIINIWNMHTNTCAK